MARQTQTQVIERLEAEIQSLRTMLNQSQEKNMELLEKFTSGQVQVSRPQTQAPQMQRPEPVGGRHTPTDQTPQRKAELSAMYNGIRSVVDENNQPLYPRALTDALHNHLRALVYNGVVTLPDQITLLGGPLNEPVEKVFMIRDDPNPQIQTWVTYYDTEVAARFPERLEAVG